MSNGPPRVPDATAFVQRMQTRIKEAKLCLKQAQDRQKVSADLHRRPVDFSVGDKVLLNTKTQKANSKSQLKKPEKSARKFMPKWIGPFTVTQHRAVALPPTGMHAKLAVLAGGVGCKGDVLQRMPTKPRSANVQTSSG